LGLVLSSFGSVLGPFRPFWAALAAPGPKPPSSQSVASGPFRARRARKGPFGPFLGCFWAPPGPEPVVGPLGPVGAL